MEKRIFGQMGTIWFTVWGILFIITQASHVMCYTCKPGFESYTITFKVTREQLRQGMKLGKVNFTDCTKRTRFLFRSDDDHFVVETDGTLMVKRQVVLHEGHRDFFIHSWDSQGHKMTVPVMVLLLGHHHGNHNAQHHLITLDSGNNTESATDEAVSIIHFPKSAEGLRRRKRGWVIPEISVSENERKAYPLKISQIRSDEDQKRKIYYSITGPGADEEPVGLFTMDRTSGILYITQPLDREKQAKYMFKAHAVAEGAGRAEEPMDVNVIVIDQNDNNPIFEKSTYVGEVAEASKIGYEVIQVVATDLDEPNNDNSDIRYSILSQEPTGTSSKLFVINEVTGMIRVNALGLDREIIPQYTLVVQAADMQGRGLSGNAKVILKVTDRNDNAPVFTQPSSATDEAVSIIHWVIPEISVSENERRDYPLKISQIRSDEDQKRKIYYSITGPGADEEPVGLFTMDRTSGILYITQPLDREKQAKYMLKAHAVAEGAGPSLEPMDFSVIVIDQNDNNPIFEKSTYVGEVAEASKIGYEVIQVVATDLDEPNNDNSDIRYSILSQEPTGTSSKLFVINEVTGMIRVNALGLDREIIPQYTLVVQAADMQGKGLSGNTKVILKVTDSNDNAPVFTQPSSATDEAVSIIHWVIPEISVSENERRDCPLKISQIRSDEDQMRKIYYSITGPGADEEPVGLFTMDRTSGILYITQPLDREKQAKYMLKAHAVAEGAGPSLEPMDFSVIVIDQNDNNPIFEKSTYVGEVAEASKIGYEVIQVVATDLDEPNNDNSDIRYSILSQEPTGTSSKLFVINEVTGMIRVNALGLDREIIPQYTLVVQAADMQGRGLSGNTKVILKVTDSNDNAPVFTQPSSATDEAVSIIHFPKSAEGLRRRKRGWVIPEISVSENERKAYPLKISQFKASVAENQVNALVVKLSVTDGEEPHSPAWKFQIVDGDPGKLFTVETGTNKQEGIIKTATGLDFEKSSTHTLLVTVENDGPFAAPAFTATATVTVTVQDVNEPPVFEPKEKLVWKDEVPATGTGTRIIQLIKPPP
ncbi:cadherin-1 isoform 2-T2 [Odontesthes bonariensis]|uniref:cadherin-1 isoform X2 n=1 Tax=Odontesthes bonariensis TaxID=219752 RepID=UPI003F58EC0A